MCDRLAVQLSGCNKESHGGQFQSRSKLNVQNQTVFTESKIRKVILACESTFRVEVEENTCRVLQDVRVCCVKMVTGPKLVVR